MPSTIAETITELPDIAYATLEGIAEHIAKCEADRADPEANHVGCVVSLNGSQRPDLARVIAFLEKVDPAVSGQGGSATTFRAACDVVRFGIVDPDTVCRLLWDHYNDRCKPPWPRDELLHKAEDACKTETRRDRVPSRGVGPPPSENGNGRHDDDPPGVNEAADDPYRLARLFLRTQCKHKGKSTLVYQGGQFFQWVNSAYRPMAEHALNTGLSRAIKAEFNRLNRLAIEAWKDRGEKDEAGHPSHRPEARKVSTRLIGDTRHAVGALTFLSDDIKSPAWLIANPPFPATDVVPFSNVLVHLPSFVAGNVGAIHPATPDYFCPYALEFAFDPNAPHPTVWNAFKASVWPNDQESADTLEEWMGYCLTPDTRQQTIAMLIGPSRSGRGTIARVMQALVGEANVANPTFSGLAAHFGAECLIGRPLAIIGDARLSRRSDWATALERFLGVAGEDSIGIPRKNREDWRGKLLTRFMVISNELPEIPDESQALTARLLVLQFTESFKGREDRTLDEKLRAELPGICLIAIEGWKRLRNRGRFQQPQSSEDTLDQFRELSSPVGTYVRERLTVGSGLSVRREAVYSDWKAWCESKGRGPSTDAALGKKLHAVLPKLKSTRPREDGDRVRYYEGIELKAAPVF